MSLPPQFETRVRGAPVSAHVATTVNDRPHVAPVWYLYDDGVVSFVTGGRKLANIRRNPRVAISIERADVDAVGWWVTLQGTATIHDDEGLVERFDDRAFEKYWEPEEPDDPTGEEQYVPVDIGTATGGTS